MKKAILPIFDIAIQNKNRQKTQSRRDTNHRKIITKSRTSIGVE